MCTQIFILRRYLELLNAIYRWNCSGRRVRHETVKRDSTWFQNVCQELNKRDHKKQNPEWFWFSATQSSCAFQSWTSACHLSRWCFLASSSCLRAAALLFRCWKRENPPPLLEPLMRRRYVTTGILVHTRFAELPLRINRDWCLACFSSWLLILIDVAADWLTA